jgi:hypothetical protein
MTDLVPSNQLVSRQANASVAPAPAPMSLSEIERVCNMIASGGDMVPACYRGKPGAVYLLLMWSRKHGVDELTAIHNVYPIKGKMFVGADLRVDLASDRGYDFETISSDAEACLLRVTDPKGRTKLVAAVMPGAVAPPADITLTIPEVDANNYLKGDRPSDMVYAAACRVADRRLVRSPASLVDAAQDYEPEPDPLDMLISVGPDLDDDTTDAEVVEDEPATAAELIDLGTALVGIPEPAEQLPATAEELIAMATTAGIKPPRVELLKMALRLGHSVGTIDALLANPEALAAVVAEIRSEQQ